VGTFVTQVRPAVSSRFELDLGVTEAVAAANQRLGVQLLRASIERPPTAIAERIDLGRTTAVLWVERVIRVNDVPAAHAIDAIPEDVVRGAVFDGGSVYQFLEEQCGLALAGGTADVTAVSADRSMARLLAVDEGAALLRIDQVERSRADRPVLYSAEHYVPTVLNLSVRRVRHGARDGR
jgi:DNA-binding GntR family transcriptional regulator